MRTRIVKSQDVELYVVEDGNPKKPAILFLHGFPDCHKVWEYQLRDLARDFHVIAFDLRGCGHSSPSARRDAYRIEQVLPDILAVIDATVGRDGKVHLVGHDWGSVLGWSFVADARYAQRVLSWTSMSGPHVGLMWQWLYRKTRDGLLRRDRDALKSAFEQFAHSWYIFALNIPGAGRALFRFAGVEVWRRGLMSGGVTADDPYLDVGQDEVLRIVLGPIGLYQQNAFRPPAVPAPHSIRLPVQLVVPVHDNFIRPQLFEYIDETCADVTRVTLDANHWAQRTHADEFTGLVRGFIARLGGSKLAVKPSAGRTLAKKRPATVKVAVARAPATKATRKPASRKKKS